MNIDVITSFNEKYYNMIGKDCVSTWLSFWPTKLKLTCYVEEFSLPESNRLKQIPFNQLPQSYFNFQNIEDNERVRIFSKKAFSVIHAFENSTADRIIWIDADLLTDKSVPFDFLKTICPDDTLATFMGVNHHKERHNPNSEIIFSAETGFFVVNPKHPDFKKFANRYKEYYEKRLSANLRRFYDGDVFGAVVKEFTNTKFNDLCLRDNHTHKTPLKRTSLGMFFTHVKAKRSKDEYIKSNMTQIV
jgi:hypothetical protein